MNIRPLLSRYMVDTEGTFLFGTSIDSPTEFMFAKTSQGSGANRELGNSVSSTQFANA